MPMDLKRLYKESYTAKAVPMLVTPVPAYYAAMAGQGNPNEPEGAFQQAVSALYGVLYTIKMSKNGERQLSGYEDFVVPPLEGLWAQDGAAGMDYAHKERMRWVALLRLPDFVTEEDFAWAVAEAARKKKLDTSGIERRWLDEGLCVQALHIGSYDAEPATVAQMDAYIAAQGYENDISATRWHHEVYLSDGRKGEPEKQKTIIRHPVRKKEA